MAAKKAKNEDKIICIRCGETTQSNFYKSQDVAKRHFGLFPYCKDCVKFFFAQYMKKYNNNIALSIYYMCRKIDLVFNYQVYLGAIKSTKNENSSLSGDDPEKVLSAYFKGVALGSRNGQGACFDDSSGEENIQGLSTALDVIKLKRKNREVLTEIPDETNSEYEYIEYNLDDLYLKWGNFEVEDIEFLESEYLDWDFKLGGIGEKSVDLVVKELCYISLELRKVREREGVKTDHLINSMDRLLKTGGLIEKQNQAQKSELVGVRIKDLEKFRPAPEPLEEFADIDKLNDLRDSIAGAMFKSSGTNENFYTKRFDEIMKPYTIDFIEDKVSATTKLLEEAGINDK